MPQGSKSSGLKETGSLDMALCDPSPSRFLTPDSVWAKKELLKDELRVGGFAAALKEPERLLIGSAIKETLKADLESHRKGIGSRTIQLFVKTIYDELLTVQVLPEDTIGDLKVRVSEKTGKKLRGQQLRFAGKTLRDDLSIKDYNITENSTVWGYFSMTGLRIGR